MRSERVAVVLALLLIISSLACSPVSSSLRSTRFRAVVFYYGWLNTSNLFSLRFDVLVFAGTRNVMINQYSVISELRKRSVEVYAYLHDGDQPIGMGTSFRKWVAQNRTGTLEERAGSWRKHVEELITRYEGKVDGVFLDECDPSYFGTTDPDSALVKKFSSALREAVEFAHSKGLKVFVNGVRAYASLGDYYLWEDFVSVYDGGYKLFFPEKGSSNPYDWTNGLPKYEYLLKHGLLNRTIALSFADRSTIKNAELAYYMARSSGWLGGASPT